MASPEAALFLDYENIYIGHGTTFGAIPDIRVLFDAIAQRLSVYGAIIARKANGSW